jgi:hypothetical protein
MKNFLFIVLSISIFSACTNDKPIYTLSVNKIDSVTVARQDSIIKSKSLADSLKYVIQFQNGVSDTSHTSLTAAYKTSQELANMIDDEAYKSSLYLEKLHDKNQQVQNAISKLDGKLRELNKIDSEVANSIKQKKQNAEGKGVYAKVVE